MKRTFLTLAVSLLVISTLAASNTSPQDEYIHRYARIAVSEMRRTGIPASITLAQGILESGSGRGTLAVQGNNHFGIKCHKNWTGKKMYHDDDAKGECFRVYPSAEASYRDHSDFLRYNDRYKFLFDLKSTDYKSWAYGLKKAGYATDPAYPEKLISLIETYRLNRYDVGKVTVDSPTILEMPRRSNLTGITEKVVFDIKRPVYLQNGVQFVYATSGETFSSIALAYDLFIREILAFNDLDKETELRPGDIVYIQPKKSKTVKGLDKHIVDREGETLYNISQRYGVKLSKLCKRNALAAEDTLVIDQIIKLR